MRWNELKQLEPLSAIPSLPTDSAKAPSEGEETHHLHHFLMGLHLHALRSQILRTPFPSMRIAYSMIEEVENRDKIVPKNIEVNHPTEGCICSGRQPKLYSCVLRSLWL